MENTSNQDGSTSPAPASRVAAAAAGLDELVTLPLAAQPDAYEQLVTELQAVLADVEQA